MPQGERIGLHHTFAWRIAAVMEGDEESIKQEILGTDTSEVASKIGDRGQAIYLRTELERIMGSKTVEEIIPEMGKQQLKQQLLEKLRSVFGDQKVKSIYIYFHQFHCISSYLLINSSLCPNLCEISCTT